MTSVPWALLEREYSNMGVEAGSLPPRDQRAVGMVFMPQAEEDAAVCRSVIEKIMDQAGLTFYGWRTVPVDPSSLGPQSRENQPTIEQVGPFARSFSFFVFCFFGGPVVVVVVVVVFVFVLWSFGFFCLRRGVQTIASVRMYVCMYVRYSRVGRRGEVRGNVLF